MDTQQKTPRLNAFQNNRFDSGAVSGAAVELHLSDEKSRSRRKCATRASCVEVKSLIKPPSTPGVDCRTNSNIPSTIEHISPLTCEQPPSGSHCSCHDSAVSSEKKRTVLPQIIDPKPKCSRRCSAADGAGEVQLTREQRRSRRKWATRARTESLRRLTKRQLERGRDLYPETDYWKPATRAECKNIQRPCPFVSCRYNLYLDVDPDTGSCKYNFPHLEVWQMDPEFSCVLDVAERGEVTLEELGAAMNLTRERVRQIEVKARADLFALDEIKHLRQYIDEGPKGKNRFSEPSDDLEDGQDTAFDEEDDESEDAFDQSSRISFDDFYV